MRRSFTALGSLALLTNCVAPPVRAPAPVPRPTTMPSPPPPVMQLPSPFDTGVEPGIWTYRSDPRVSGTRFGVTPESASLAVQCDLSTRTITVMATRTGAATGGAMTLRATSMVKAFAVEGTGSYAVARLTARDPILDALAFSRGRFGVAIDGVERAYPAWPELTRVIEDCRA
ncbi:MAG: hypothetical protein ABI898_09720 [Sphingomonadales bacterium]